MAAATLRRVPRLSHLKRCFSATGNTDSPIKIGDHLPDVNVYEDNPFNIVNIPQLFKGKKGILFSVPGAFVPGCTTHLPEYVRLYDNLKKEGCEEIVCITINDPYVTAAWNEASNTKGKIRMLSDMHGEFTKAVDMELQTESLLGNIRSKRYALVVDDGVVVNITDAPDDTGLSCLLCLRSHGKPDKKQSDRLKRSLRSFMK